MSKETALQFFNELEHSLELRQQLKSLQEETPEEISRYIEVAAKAGYTFSVDELRAAVKALAEQRLQTGELSEDDLEAVAGGNCPCHCSYGGNYMTAVAS